MIRGNKIGTNAAGSRLMVNGKSGVFFEPGLVRGFPNHNTIGPGNVIISSAPDSEEDIFAGVRMEGSGTSYNSITGNYIGCNKSGVISTAYNSGVVLLNGAHHNTIGPENVIAKNKKHGIYIHSNVAIANTITRNSIFGNSRKAILLEAGANSNLRAPEIMTVESGLVKGTALPNSRVELFADDQDQARLFLGSVLSDANGAFQFTSILQQGFITATVTDGAGNTSELSSSRPLPVELLSFRGHAEKSRIHLQWTTITESNNLGFFVERKLPGEQFEEIGFVPGAGTTSTSQTYHFYDVPQKGPFVYYRIQQKDLKGALVYSQQIKVQLVQPVRFTLSPAWPNPFNGSTTVRFVIPQSARVEIHVLNILGERIRRLTQNLYPAGEYQVQWDGLDDRNFRVGSGVYFIRMTCREEGVEFMKKVLYVR